MAYLDTELTTIQCGTCGVWHAIPTVMYDNCKREGGFWTCPNGHSRGWAKGTLSSDLAEAKKEQERLRKRLISEQAATQREREKAEKSEHRRVAQKAATTRLKNRVKHGVCPCCNRQVKQLAEHMKAKHPDYVAEK